MRLGWTLLAGCCTTGEFCVLDLRIKLLSIGYWQEGAALSNMFLESHKRLSAHFPLSIHKVSKRIFRCIELFDKDLFLTHQDKLQLLHRNFTIIRITAYNTFCSGMRNGHEMLLYIINSHELILEPHTLQRFQFKYFVPFSPILFEVKEITSTKLFCGKYWVN